VDVEKEEVVVVVAGGSGFTTTNWDFVLSQVAHASGFEGSSSNRPRPVSQQSTVLSQQNDVSLLVTLAQDIRSGPILGAVFQAWSAITMLGRMRLMQDETKKLTQITIKGAIKRNPGLIGTRASDHVLLWSLA
jgi:hypothetical protein